MPSNADITRCPRCAAAIIWTVTAAGARMAVNAASAPDGNQAVYADGTGRQRSRAITADRPTLEHAEWRAMPHAATCLSPPPRRPRHTPRPVRRPGAWRYR